MLWQRNVERGSRKAEIKPGMMHLKTDRQTLEDIVNPRNKSARPAKPCGVLSYIYIDWCSARDWRELLDRFLELFLCIDFSSPETCPTDSSWLGILKLQLSLLNSAGFPASLCSPFSCAVSWKLSFTYYLYKAWAHFCCFVSLGDCIPILPKYNVW